MQYWELKLSQDFHSGAVMKIEYDANGDVLYRGIAQLNAPDSAAAWLIFKYTNGAEGPTVLEMSRPNQIWDDRASIF